MTIELLAKTLPPMKCQFLIREVRADASVAVAKADVNGALDTNLKRDIMVFGNRSPAM